jgi:hypothetical protein
MVKAMVTDILKAREELTKMPDKTKSLLNLVDCADKSLEKLHPAASALGGSESEAGMIHSPDQDRAAASVSGFPWRRASPSSWQAGEVPRKI